MAFALLRASEAVAANEAAWAALREGGTVALVNHARAPGKGDPVGFRLGNCATQRDLSWEGREQASRLGARFRAENVPVISVKSSRWCRTLHTAGLAFPAVSTDPDQTLDPLGQDPEMRDKRTKRVRELIENWRRRLGTLVLVTHGSNISAQWDNRRPRVPWSCSVPGQQLGSTLWEQSSRTRPPRPNSRTVEANPSNPCRARSRRL